eukprot:1618836-Amphidinium_carterae.1
MKVVKRCESLCPTTRTASQNLEGSDLLTKFWLLDLISWVVFHSSTGCPKIILSCGASGLAVVSVLQFSQ